MDLPETTSNAAANCDITLQARLRAQNASGQVIPLEGNAITVGDCSTLTCVVQGRIGNVLDTPTTPTVSPATQISDLLTADNIWTKNGALVDTTGRNFTHHIPGVNFPTANHIYRITYTLTLTDGTAIIWWHEHLAE